MNTNNISPQIKDALKGKVNRTAPAGLASRIMHEVRTQHQLKVAPPSVNGILVIGLAIALLTIGLPYYLENMNQGGLFESFSFPVISVTPAVWLSIIAIGLLLAADQIMSKLKLRRII